MTWFSSSIPRILTALLVLSLFGMACYKAATASFTHDESFTYNLYVTAPVDDIFSYKVVSPNNHLLNTLLMKAFSAVAGSSVFVLRLPNLLAFAGFMVFILLLLRKLHRWAALTVFALVCSNPYMIDFFALARGNGLSLCFMAGSIYFFLRFVEDRKIAAYGWAVLSGFLAVVSHFTLLYYLLAMMAAANLRPFIERYFSAGKNVAGWKLLLRVNFVNTAALLALGLIMWGPVAKLTAGNQFFYGGESGFWKDTVGSLTETFFYGAPYGHYPDWIARVVVAVLAVVAVIASVYAAARKEKPLEESARLLLILVLILVFMVVINLLHFYLTGTKLLIRRYALLYAPVFMLIAGFLLFSRRNGRLIPVMAVPAGLLALAVTLHTLLVFSPTTYLDWDYETETHHVMERMAAEVPAGTPEASVTMGVTWLFEPTVNFYRQTMALSWLKPVTRDGPGIAAGWYYVVHEDVTKIPLHGSLPEILFDDGKTVLVRLQ